MNMSRLNTFYRILSTIFIVIITFKTVSLATEMDSLQQKIYFINKLIQNSGLKLIERIRFDISEDEWNNTSKESYVYNDSSLLYQILGYKWSSSAWNENTKTTFIYNTDSTVNISLLEQNTGTWTYIDKYIYTYDINKNVTLSEKFRWKNFDWDNYQKIQNTFDGNENKIKVYTQMWINDAWANMFNDSLSYNGNNKLIEIVTSTWAPTNEWVEAGKKLYTYDVNGNEIEVLSQTKPSGVWVDHGKTSKSYDTSGNIIEKLQQIWDSTTWTNSSKSLYFYNSLGDLFEDYYYLWVVDSFAVHHKLTYFYEELTPITAKTTGSHNGHLYSKTVALPNSSILLQFYMPEKSNAIINIVNVLGKNIKEISFSNLPSGLNTIPIQTNFLTNGIYFLRVNTGKKFFAKKVVIVK